MRDTRVTRRPSSSGGGQVRQRLLLGGLVLAVLLAATGFVGYLTRNRGADSTVPASGSASPAPHRTTATAPVSPSPSPTDPGSSPAPPAPATLDPLTYAKAAGVALWSYDTRTATQPEYLGALHHWLSPETGVADADSVDAQVPSPVMWSRMADYGQRATATATSAAYPAAFTTALQKDPAAITGSYVYAVTVTGTQSITWNGASKSGGGRQSFTTTLAVQCRPSHNCTLAGVLPEATQ